MDHSYAEEHGLAAAYLAGRLSESERDAFEAHYFDCEACLERLETEEGFREGMLQAAAEDVAAATKRTRVGLLAVFAALSLRHRFALAGALLVLALLAALPGLWLAGRNRGLERQLATASTGAERQRAALEARLHTLEQAAADERRRLAAAADHPEVNVPIFLLAAVRSGEGAGREPVNQIPLAADAGSVILTFELATIDYPAYRASLHGADGKEIWQASGLHPDSRDTLVLLLPASMVPPGVYRLTIEGARDGGKGATVAACPFRVVRRP